MSKAIVEDLGDGQWLIKPTGEIRKCSRSTAYRIAKKAEKQMQELEAEHEAVMENEIKEIDTIREIPTIEEEETEVIELDNEEGLTEETFEVEIEEESTTPIFDLPSLDDLNGGGGGDGENPDTFLEGDERDQAFIESLKNAEVVEDVEGNRKVRIGDLLIGNNPVILSMLRTCDNSLYGWAENKHGIELWNQEARAVQRAFFVKLLGMVSPKMSVELDPSWVIVGMIGWLYGVPMLKVLRMRKKPKKLNPYENQPVVVLDG